MHSHCIQSLNLLFRDVFVVVSVAGDAPLRNDVTDLRGKQILKANKQNKASSRGGGGGVRTS